MIVLIVEKTTPSLRGELSRWLLQPKAGVFIGRLTARVRELLWEKVCQSRRGGGAMLIYTDRTEQGFTVRTCGRTAKTLIDAEGLWLVRRRSES
jgi:CRISPR-associated protein Cas2